MAADLRIDGTTGRSGAGKLAFIEGLMRALAATTPDELDAGNWQRSVGTYDGPVSVSLRLPLLLEAEQGEAAGPRLTAMSRLAGQSSRGDVSA